MILVKAAETKRKIISKIKSRIKMPVSGQIISDYGEGKDQHKLKNGLVLRLRKIHLLHRQWMVLSFMLISLRVLGI